ncbi:hypothetical protein ACOMHN_009568 [Nucella lapillus]
MIYQNGAHIPCRAKELSAHSTALHNWHSRESRRRAEHKGADINRTVTSCFAPTTGRPIQHSKMAEADDVTEEEGADMTCRVKALAGQDDGGLPGGNTLLGHRAGQDDGSLPGGNTLRRAWDTGQDRTWGAGTHSWHTGQDRTMGGLPGGNTLRQAWDTEQDRTMGAYQAGTHSARPGTQGRTGRWGLTRREHTPPGLGHRAGQDDGGLPGGNTLRQAWDTGEDRTMGAYQAGTHSWDTGQDRTMGAYQAGTHSARPGTQGRTGRWGLTRREHTPPGLGHRAGQDDGGLPGGNTLRQAWDTGEDRTMGGLPGGNTLLGHRAGHDVGGLPGGNTLLGHRAGQDDGGLTRHSAGARTPFTANYSN